MNLLENIKDQFEQVQSANSNSGLQPIQKDAFTSFSEQGIPTSRHEEWKYTRVGNLFNKEYQFSASGNPAAFSKSDLDQIRLPQHENANEIVFINGRYEASLSTLRSEGLTLLPLDVAAAGEFASIVKENLGQSGRYIKDGIHALNTAFISEGLFIHIEKARSLAHPIYFYYITDARSTNVLAQPRILIHVAERGQVQMAETYFTLGSSDSFTNQVVEVVVEEAAHVELYRIQNDGSRTSQVGTTHFRQRGKSVVHAVTISLNGGLVRNNLNIAMEADHSEAHMYGLYYLTGQSHVDNHTLVIHARPHCESNELYKGVIGGKATGVFNGKIMVEQPAQKTNAYQSNKNVLLSDAASVHTKPQLEIFADDVKCSHGCTVGRLDEESMFYLRSRGITESSARALLIQAFAMDILEHIKPAALREHVEKLISERLESETHDTISDLK